MIRSNSQLEYLLTDKTSISILNRFFNCSDRVEHWPIIKIELKVLVNRHKQDAEGEEKKDEQSKEEP